MIQKSTLVLLAGLVLGGGTLGAQAYQLPATPAGLKAPAPYVKPAVNDLGTGLPPESSRFTPSQNALDFRTTGQETIIGTTAYDLQSNGSNCRRINASNSGAVYGTWTQGGEPLPASPDRGTGYNKSNNGTTWPAPPTARAESQRTGWPNHVLVGNKEFIVSHTSASGLSTLSREIGASTWTEGSVPVNVTGGVLWPRAASGGANGQTIHIIAITTPVANGGTVYQGVDGHVLYYRSQDAGATWDIQNAIIPGLDSMFTTGSSADGYYLDASGETVAIGVFNDFDDVLVFKSDDNGSTWTKHIVNDFPLVKYVADQGYTLDDLPPYNEEQPDSLAILTSDNSGCVLVDNSGTVHAFYGRMYVADTDLADGNTSYYPGTNGLAYWNESFGEDSTVVIAGALDLDGNNTLDIAAITNIATYFLSLSSMPSAGIDANGNIYVTYSAVMETEEFLDPSDNQHYRHVYVMASPDGGQSWLPPFDVNVPEIAIEPDLANFIEGVFPTIARNVGSTAHIIYQQDFQPGLSVRGDSDAAGENFINHVGVDVSDLGIVRTFEPVAEDYFQLTIGPNPTNGPVNMSYLLPSEGRVRIDVYNQLGQLMRPLFSGLQAQGEHIQSFDLSQLPAGSYNLRFIAEGKVAISQLIKG